MPSVLVTGGAGFIGANFVHFWLARHADDTVVVLDALTYAGNLASLAPARSNRRFTFVHGDIGTAGLAETVLRDHRITTIVHFAAESHVDRSIVGPDPFLTTNVLGTHELLKAARKVWLEEGRGGTSVRFHHVSTDEVYGSLEPGDPPFSEERGGSLPRDRSRACQRLGGRDLQRRRPGGACQCRDSALGRTSAG
jgi:dTDP-glucose 4,6-dehydratase